jgi:hypothetical protein
MLHTLGGSIDIFRIPYSFSIIQKLRRFTDAGTGTDPAPEPVSEC